MVEVFQREEEVVFQEEVSVLVEDGFREEVLYPEEDVSETVREILQ